MQAIGVFDSGIGGLTVMGELMHSVPGERIVYFGDTARVPYGSKSVETVKRYAREDTELLLAHNVKLIIVACNTVSAIALEDVQALAQDIPVIGMIAPCAKAAVSESRSGNIGIIGTEATVASKAYEAALQAEGTRQQKTVHTFARACPLFVPLAEEGWVEHQATRLVAEEYLRELKSANVDTLILGCTHYPVLTEMIQSVMGPEVRLINSGAVAAREVKNHILDSPKEVPEHLVLVSDVPRKFQMVGERFLGHPLPKAQQVMFKEAWVARRDTIV